MGTIAADGRGALIRCPSCGQINRQLFERFDASTRCGRCKHELPPVGEPVDASSSQIFQGLMRANLPVLVDFWAEWCGPCKMMAPELDRFARDNAGRVLVAKVDTERAQDLAARFQITAIPTVALFIHGGEASRIQGARSSAQLDSFVREVMAAH